jgi:ribosomal RNA-processing protein 7
MSVKSESTSLSNYRILRVLFPPQPAFPKPATHYIYLRPDTPKTPTLDTPRSLFLANIPIDASETSLRALFKQLGGALVDKVHFEDDAKNIGVDEVTVKGERWARDNEKPSVGMKRKRNAEAGNDGETDFTLPSTWDFKTHQSGSSAVVVFVDAATAQAVIKECARMAKRKESVEWKASEELGERRKHLV